VLDTATSATFKPHVGDRFEVTPQEGEPFEAVLSRCEETTYGSPGDWRETGQRVPFSLLFHGPADGAVAQQICGFRHAELGQFDLFIVPLGPDEQGMRYEAVIS
jgi:uncharacterized protein DUF6916